jgi:very-short-patch-repair endonuclease
MASRDWRAVAELAASQHGVITRTQAAAVGFRSHHFTAALRSGRLAEPVPGVLVDQFAPASWRQRLAIATTAVDGIAFGQTAAHLHRLDGVERPLLPEVLIRRGARPPSRRQFVVRVATPLPDADVVTVDGIRTVTIARALCELGRTCTDDTVEQALDDALRRGVSLRWITETHSRLHRPGPTGTGALARVLQLSDRSGVVPDSWRERITERLLSQVDLGPMTRQFEVRNSAGEFVGRLDLALVDCRVGIEYHSDQWHHGPRRGRGDRRRDAALAAVGWQVLYLDATDHRSPAEAVELVRATVAQRRRAA